MPKTATTKPAPFVRKPMHHALERRRLLSADLNLVAHNTLLATLSLQGAEFRALVEAEVVLNSERISGLALSVEAA